MAKLVTNQQEFLTEIIEKILPCSDSLHFLVGYFYFSGFEQIYKNLGDRKLRILVGMSIEKDISNKIREFQIIQEVNHSRLEIKNNYFKSLVDVFNDTDFFDNDEKQEAFRIFFSKIKDGSLEIKKTEQPNHAKLYLFEHTPEHNQSGLLPGTMITGSSNLSLSGMKNRQEINVILRDEYSEGKKLFDDLWENHSVDIVREGDLDDFLTEVVEKLWIDKLYHPFLFYLRVLLEYFEIEAKEEITFPDKITEGRFFDLKYQKDAIIKALNTLDQHNGVLICDVVGLGKSIIASAVAFNLRKKVIIIAPPHLHYQWDQEYRTLFGLNAVVYGSSSIDKALEHLKKVWNDEEVLIIVDEAHKYRNENTSDYLNLHRLCQGNKVILLTATPFNNRPQDIFAMIKLFQIPSKSTIRTVDNLSSQFQDAVKEYRSIEKARKKENADQKILKKRLQSLAAQIRLVLEPVVIRRSRIDLEKIEEYRKDLDAQNIKYLFAEPPVIKEYYLGDLSGLYLKTLNRIYPKDAAAYPAEEQTKVKSEFIGARYKPVNYLLDLAQFKEKLKKEHPHIDPDSLNIAQINLADFMRRLLVARFESSVYAFGKTLDSMIHSMTMVKGYYDKVGKVPVFKIGQLPDIDKLLDNLDDSTLAELEDYTFEKELDKQYEKGLFFIPKSELRDDFINDLRQDIDLLKNIHDEWFSEGIRHDPKLESFRLEIKQQLLQDPARKIIVFSEYADTAEYIYKELNRRSEKTRPQTGTKLAVFTDKPVRILFYSGQISTTQHRRTVRENFDASSSVQRDDYDVLIATDALSEGVNLNRAGTVFNYDIPYNPTRVIQRVGRINRIGKMLFDKIYIYNYFPTDIGEKEIRKKQVSTLKKAMIDALLGEDTRILTKEEELRSYFHEKYNAALALQEEESWDTQYQEELYYLKKTRPEWLEKAKEIPHRARIRRTAGKDTAGVIIFGKKGEDYTFRLGKSEKESAAISVEQALSLFQADFSEKPQQVSKDFDKIYQNARKNMFVPKTHLSIKGPKGEAINKIEHLKETVPVLKDYLTDLYNVAKELNSLPEGLYSYIRTIDERTLKADLQELQKLAPQDYLAKIIKTARTIEEGKETLILSEELIKKTLI
jgi:superfamily II DNA or RNA helicase